MALSRKLNRCHVGECAHVQLGDWSHHACSPVGLSVLICKIGGAERPVTERAWEVGAGLHARSTAKDTQEVQGLLGQAYNEMVGQVGLRRTGISPGHTC